MSTPRYWPGLKQGRVTTLIYADLYRQVAKEAAAHQCLKRLEAMRRLFVFVLLTALFVASIDATWPKPAVSWLRSLGGKLGLKTDLDGLYVLLAGIGSVFATAASLTFALHHPFPFHLLSSG